MNPTIPPTNRPNDLKIAFFGTPRFAQIVLENLISSDFKPFLVVTAPDAKSGRGQMLTPPPVKQTAIGAGIRVTQPIPGLDPEIFSGSDPDLTILVAYGQIITKEVLEISKLGFLNVHPSLLPKYRGPSPIQQAILDGEKTSGVTIIKLDEELDHGPILGQREIPIEANDTHLTLIEKLGAIGSNLLLELLPDYVSGKAKLSDQDHPKATLTKKITKEDGHIDFSNPPDARTLDRMIRAYYPWPTVWGEIEVKSEKGKVQRVKLLPEKMVQMEGKNPITIEMFAKLYPAIYIPII
ncbi:methionyl-tRNA formyltransferase [Candidatus Curtissbacteria bacterium]|nr:methionyl-tRNA formyltransferase [Candidatus Curtissbacteria bacterium]